jgi:hypothetical protein
MSVSTDTVLLTVAQIVASFEVSAGAVRAWVASGLLKPVRREGRGPGGVMFFARGEVSNLVHGSCPVCGNGFKKATLRQRFCSKVCRQRWARLHKGEP